MLTNDTTKTEPTTFDLSRLLGVALLSLLLILPGCLGEDDINAAAKDLADDLAEQCLDALEDDDHDDEDEHDEESAGAEACEHYDEGPFVAVAAVTEATDADIEAVGDDHKAYQISLTENTATSEFFGFVEFAAAEEADYLFLFSEDVDVHFTAAGSSEELEIEETVDSIEGCDLVKTVITIELPVGTTILEIEGGSVEAVDLVIEEAGGHDEHGHDDEDDDHDEHDDEEDDDHDDDDVCEIDDHDDEDDHEDE